MLALNRTTIDFFSLDVEGAEIQVLQTIDFNKIDIRTLTVEYNHVEGGQDALSALVTSRGLKLHKIITDKKIFAKDMFFIRNDMTPLVDLVQQDGDGDTHAQNAAAAE